MSYFDERLPQQDLLEAVYTIRYRHSLTVAEVIVVLVKVLEALVDQYDHVSEDIRTKALKRSEV